MAFLVSDVCQIRLHRAPVKVIDRFCRSEATVSAGYHIDYYADSVFKLLAPTGSIRPPPRWRSRPGTDAGRT